MLKQYDNFEINMALQNNEPWFFEPRLNYFACDILDTLEITDADERVLSLNRAFQACGTLQISINRNFKRVYRFDGENLIIDWKISSLACYLIVINCNPSHEQVAKAQLYFAMNSSFRK